MVTSQWLALGGTFLLWTSFAGCGTPKDHDEPTERKRGALSGPLFQPSVTYGVGSRPEAVAIGDLDGDGNNDVALLTSRDVGDAANDYKVHVFLQGPNGSLLYGPKYTIGLNAQSMDIGDVNGDGRPDVVVGVSNNLGSQIGVLLQNAAGTLDPVVFYATVHSYQVKIGDFNSDGRMDVAGIAAGVFDDGVDVLLQTETGTLATPVTYHAPHGGFDELDAGDIDGDGRTDLVVMSGSGYASPNVSVLLQTPEGTFGEPTSYTLGPNQLTRGVAVGDTNGDGRTDIVVSTGGNRPSSFIARFLQNAEGTMDPATLYASYDIPGPVVLADMDADGRKDVLVTHNGWNRLGLYRQTPSGDFGAEELYAIPPASSYQPQGLAVGDINGDLRPDAVIADRNSGLVVLRHVNDVSVAINVTAPGPSYVDVPTTVRWSVAEGITLLGFDVSVSYNGGASYSPLPGCTGLAATARECPWTPSGPPTSLVRMRVTSRDELGRTGSGERLLNVFAASITVTAPATTAHVGATTMVRWTHNLPSGGAVRIELSRDGGSSFETLAASAPNVSAFAWTVTGPDTTTARVRVIDTGSTGAAGTGSSFSILTPALTVTAPAAGATMNQAALSVNWTHNVPTATSVRIEISRDGGATFETLAAAAPTGPAGGSFTGAASGADSSNAVVRVTTNGTVVTTGTSAPFSLLTATATIANPPAGAAVFAGVPLAVTWSTNLPADLPVSIDISRDDGGSYQNLATGLPNTGSFGWIVTGPDTPVARLRLAITGSETTVATSGAFAILTPSLTAVGPSGTIYPGTYAPLSWSTNVSGGTVLVELSRDGGGSFETLANAAANTGSFLWTASGPDDAAVRFRVTLNVAPAISSTTSAFAILTPSLTVTGPDAGTLAYAGTPLTITWTSNLPTDLPVAIELSRDGGAFSTLFAGAPNTGSFTWTVSPTAVVLARVRVTVISVASASHVSGAFAIVVPTVTVNSPAGGENWAIGTARTVSWTSNDLPADATVRVEMSRDGGGTWTALASSAPASGNLPWTATAPATTSALVRVSANGAVPAVGTSGPFTIGSPTLAVTAPAAGASWVIGAAQTIAWTSNLLPSTTVKIQLSRNGGSTYTTLTSAAPNTGSYSWKAAGSATTTAIVRVVANGIAANAVSGQFSLTAGSVTVAAPNTAASWKIGTVQAISWTHNGGAGAQFKIEVSRSGVWSVIAETVPAGGATSGSYEWTVTGPTTGNAKVRVTWTANTAAKDTSDVSFKIVN